MNELEITTLIENMPAKDPELIFEHGLSLYIEFDGKKILFDTGQTGDFLKNAHRLNKSLAKIDDVIISHGHYDHAGGLRKALPELTNAQLYVGEEFFKPKYKRLENDEFKYNGVDFSEELLKEKHISYELVHEHMTYLTEHVILFKNFKRTNDFEQLNPKFHLKENGQMHLDAFTDEVSLVLITSKGLVVILGCSHVGVVNMLTDISESLKLPIYAVLGGTHLVEADENRMQKTIETFQHLQIQKIAVSHCTSENGIQMLQKACPKQFILNNTGNVFCI